jgi:hypothetical protein
LKDTKYQDEVKKHYLIKLNFFSHIKLLAMNNFKWLGCILPIDLEGSDSQKLLKLYDQGSRRVEKDISLERIVKNLRNMKIYMKDKFMDKV